VITVDGQEIAEGYSPFTADKYVIDMPKDITKSKQQGKDQSAK
jgi:hypothetical protein